MRSFRYEIQSHSTEPGGVWQLLMMEGESEVDSEVFPADPADRLAMDTAYADALHKGEAWLVSLNPHAKSLRSRQASPYKGSRYPEKHWPR